MNATENSHFDILIVGAGPAGCAAAYQLADSGLTIGILDKDQFPRDKICGDALSPDVTNQFRLMNEELYRNFIGFANKHMIKSVQMVGSDSLSLEMKFANPELKGFVSKRIDFDNFFIEQIRNKPNIHIFENQRLKTVNISSEKVVAKTTTDTFSAEIILGADGANSMVKSSLIGKKVDKRHYCAGIRQYYTNVKGLESSNSIELHFMKEVLPGYLWIFPLPNNGANVGLGMLSSAVSKKNINLKEKLTELLKEHPELKKRFAEAEAQETIKGFGLPIGSQKVQCSGDRFLLLGDAASLIDPFTGEGIANAIRSGRVAADHLKEAFAAKRFDAKFNKAYDKEIYRRMWPELRISRFIQRMLRFPKLFDFVIKKASKNESFKTLITASVENVDLRQQFKKPSFFFKLFFS